MSICQYVNINNDYQNEKRDEMSDLQLGVKVQRLVIHSGFDKTEDMFCPIMKIIQMRYKDVSKEQAYRVVKQTIKN